MAFVIERLTENDVSFFNSLGIKDWTGKHQKIVVPERSTWCIDREKNVFFMRLGGGREYDPYISVFWYDGLEIRIEEENTTLDAPKKIFKILNPVKERYKQNVITQLIIDALVVIRNYHEVLLGTEKNCRYMNNRDMIIEYRMN